MMLRSIIHFSKFFSFANAYDVCTLQTACISHHMIVVKYYHHPVDGMESICKPDDFLIREVYTDFIALLIYFEI